MAANGFIELLRIAKRGNKNYVSNRSLAKVVIASSSGLPVQRLS